MYEAIIAEWAEQSFQPKICHIPRISAPKFIFFEIYNVVYLVLIW